MKTSSLSVILCILMSTAMLQADYSEIPIASGTGLANPDIDGDLVAWQGGSVATGTDIYWKIFADPNDPNTVSIAGEQISPAVSGNIVVWEDRRNGLSNPDIYWQDVTLLGDPSYPMGLTITDRQKVPAISGNIMVWHDRRNGNYDIYGYNKATDTHLTICTETTSEYESAVSGNIVVWRDGRNDGYDGNDIYMADISGSAPYSSVAVAPSNAEQYRPAIDGDIVVWEEIGAGTVSLVAYDISQGQVVWTRTQSVSMVNPDISGNIIVWQEETAGNYDILGWDLSSGALLEIATTIATETVPAISGRKVVWQRNDTDILGAEIPMPTQIAVLSPNGGEMFLARSQILIGWDIVNGTPPTEVDIDYSTDNGNSFTPVASNIAFGNLEYLWTPIADVNSIDACQMRITDVSNAAVSDISDSVFTIFQCDPNLTADLTGDCVVDIADLATLAAQWLNCGNPYDADWCFK